MNEPSIVEHATHARHGSQPHRTRVDLEELAHDIGVQNHTAAAQQSMREASRLGMSCGPGVFQDSADGFIIVAVEIL